MAPRRRCLSILAPARSRPPERVVDRAHEVCGSLVVGGPFAIQIRQWPGGEHVLLALALVEQFPDAVACGDEDVAELSELGFRSEQPMARNDLGIVIRCLEDQRSTGNGWLCASLMAGDAAPRRDVAFVAFLADGSSGRIEGEARWSDGRGQPAQAWPRIDAACFAVGKEVRRIADDELHGLDPISSGAVRSVDCGSDKPCHCQ